MVKAQQHLLDTVGTRSWRNHGVTRQWIDRQVNWIRQRKYMARRFVFDEEGSRHVGEFIRDCGDMLLDNRQFAIPPFHVTYVEMNSPALLAGIGRSSTNGLFGALTSDRQIGYLVDGDHVVPMANAERDMDGQPTFFTYRFCNSPCGPIFKHCIRSDDPHDHWERAFLLLGSSVHDLSSEAQRLNIIHGVHIDPAPLEPDFDTLETWRTLSQCSFGDVRNLWAALLMLNQKRHVEFETIPWKSGLHKGKRVVYAAHNVVRIKLSGHSTIRKCFGPHLQAPRRRHDVRGHFAHYHCVEGCVHQWPLLAEIGPNETARWKCAKCHGFRVWRKDHQRGHGGIGIVTKDYAVTD
jgi:hypothetical protein